ncbi:extracellular solute-binding protein [Luedemannella helvata]|uniref:Sugar ABC transporter substrate-binding protein n=1 Tax=Luedemannella helvata TaxID=349315 RepID=A0ABP4W138_9ACTN
MRSVLNRRRFLTAGVAALSATALALTGCTTDDPEPTTSAELSGTVTFWHAYSADSQEVKTLNEVVLPGFKAKHPGVDVKQVAIPYDQLHQKLITGAAAGDVPDVMRSDIAWVSELAKLGLLEQLDAAMPDFQELAARTFPGTLATNLYNGKYYGLPLDTNTRVLMYNADALAKAGVTEPPRTFDDLRALATKLDGKGVFAFADNGLSGWNVLPWIWSAGGDITNPEYTKATGFLNSPASVSGVQLLFDLYGQKQLPNIILGGTGGTPTSDGLATGKYATILDGPWMYPIFQSAHPDFKLQVAPVPAGPGGSVSVVGGEDVVVFRASKNKAAALEFTRYLLSEEAQLAMAKVGQMSVLKDLDVTAVNPIYGPFVQQLQTAKPRPPVPNWSKINDLLQAKLQNAFKGDLTVQAALDQAAAEIDPLLAQG